MTHISLFSGIGGIDLAAEWAGFTTIAQVECDPYCLAVLAKHWPDVPRYTDIRDFPSNVADAENKRYSGREDIRREGKANQQRCALRCESVRHSEDTSAEAGTGNSFSAVTLISGGFPCQPFSAAGKRRGRSDDRHLWPEMLRVIREVKPKYVLAENVRGLLSIESGMAFETVLTDLENAGYETWAGLIPATGVGAPHLRYRVFIVGHARKCESGRLSSISGKETATFGNASADVAYTRCFGGNGVQSIGQPRSSQTTPIGISSKDGEDWWAVEPRLGRVATRVSNRVDRLRALGNAVVPQQVYPILQAIMEVGI